MQRHLISVILALCLFSLLGSFTRLLADSTTTGQVSLSHQGMTVSVSAVDNGVFHVLAYPTAEPVPPSSPFVVEDKPLSTAIPTTNSAGDIRIATASAVFTLRHDGTLGLKGSDGTPFMPLGSISIANGVVTLVLQHSAGDRLYGAGNAGENTAGDLTHPSGTQVVTNGATRIPFLWASGGWSVFIANNQSGVTWNDSSGTLSWTIPGAYVDCYLTVAQRGSYALLNSYMHLTGIAPIPPRWTFGFMLSRWGYPSAADVADKWHQFRDRQVPVDAFIYDYDWFVNDWNFNPATFPPGSLDTMKSMGLRFVGIVKPRVNGANQTFAAQQGWLLNSPQGTDLRFDLPSADYWWWSNHQPLVQAGVAGFWNDEAEQTNDEFFQMVKTETNGFRAASPNRPWTISRAFSPGMARFGAACWTGDIDSSWSALSNQPGTLLNWSLSGMPYCGQDIGGFQSTPSPELYVRWIEEGVFVPVMRAHGTYNSPRWPWAFGDDAFAAIKKAIDQRYRLIPYLYTCAQQTTASGAPIMRPLFLEFPNDPQTYNLEDEWLVGSRILAAPILSPGGARNVYLPAGAWYDFNTGAAVSGGGQTLHIQAPLDTIPCYVRAGTILPLGPVLQSTQLGDEDPLDVRIYPGADATFSLYEDDGITYDYQNGQSSVIPMTWNEETRTFTVGERVGQYPGMLQTRNLIVTLADGTSKPLTYTGKPETLKF